jgi:hypothetical protein
MNNNTTTTENPTGELVTVDTSQFKSWFKGITDICDTYMAKNFPNNPKDVMAFSEGRRYIRITRGGSAHAFIDRKNGDVLKPASWKAPAKHARGNIFDVDNGLKFMGPYGPAYLR